LGRVRGCGRLALNGMMRELVEGRHVVEHGLLFDFKAAGCQ